MIHTEAPQNVKHRCTEEEYAAFERGSKTFFVQEVTDQLSLQVGDWITMEQTDENGELTGDRLLFQISERQTITGEGGNEYEVLGFVPPTFGSLDSLYTDYVTASLVIDRYIDPETKKEEMSMPVEPAYTPQLACPDLAQMGLLSSLNTHKWPHGRYSVTLLLSLDIDEKNPRAINADIQDTMVLTYAQREDNEREIIFVELEWTPLIGGHTINIVSGAAVTPCDVDTLASILCEAAEEEDLEDHEELYSDEAILELVRKAKESGEDVGELEELLRMRPEDIEEDENLLDPVAERLINQRKEEM